MQKCRLLLFLVILASVVNQSYRRHKLNIYFERFSFLLIAITLEALFMYESLKHLKYPLVIFRVKNENGQKSAVAELKLKDFHLHGLEKSSPRPPAWNARFNDLKGSRCTFTL